MERVLKPRILSFEIGDGDAGKTIKEYLMGRIGFSSRQLSRFKYRKNGLLLNGEKRYVNALLQAGDLLQVRLTQGGEPVEEHPHDALVRSSGEDAGRESLPGEGSACVPAGDGQMQPPLNAGRFPERDGRKQPPLNAGYLAARDGRMQKIWAPPAKWLSETYPLAILYEDEDILAADKPSGLVCHPSPGHFDDTLSSQVAEHLGRIGQELDVRVTGRLDKDTSGIVVFALNTETAAQLIRQRQARQMDKVYIARVRGHFSQELPLSGAEKTQENPESRREPQDPQFLSGTVDLPLRRESPESFRMVAAPDGKKARTHYRVLKELSDGTSVLSCRIEQGRTHQIRVHMLSIGHPIVGDRLYGPEAETTEGREADSVQGSDHGSDHGSDQDSVQGSDQGSVPDSARRGAAAPLPPLTHTFFSCKPTYRAAEGCGGSHLPPLMLHAWRSRLLQPFTGEEILLEAPLPEWAQEGEWDLTAGSI